MGAHGVKAVFFDLDNTLVDTAAAGRRAIEEVLPLSCVPPLPSPPRPRRHRGQRPPCRLPGPDPSRRAAVNGGGSGLTRASLACCR